MRSYAIRRLLLVIPTVLLISFVVFFMMRLIPGDVLDEMARGVAYGSAAEYQRFRNEVARELGLDAPLLTQYGRWLGVVRRADGTVRGLLQGYLGKSLWTRAPVLDEILHRWPVTIELALLSLLITQLLALPIGVYSALRQDSPGDYVARSFAILLITVPGFWAGTMAVVLPAVWWGHMPPLFFIPFAKDPIGNLGMLIVPAIITGTGFMGMTMRMSRSMMLEVLRQDYIRTAWAKGLGEKVVASRHALKNALIPVITTIGLQFPIMIGGAVIVEQIFVLPGMGRLILTAIQARDYPIVSGVMVFFAVWMLFMNLIVDMTYAFLDPRIRYR